MRLFLISILSVGLYFVTCCQSSGQCNKVSQLLNLINEKHVAPRALDDTFSEDVFNTFFHLLDPEHNIFTQKDIMYFSSWKYEIDSYLAEGKCDFTDSLSEFYKKRIIKVEEHIKWAKRNLPNLNEPDTLISSTKLNEPYAEDEMGLRKRWVSELRFLSLSKEMLRDTSLNINQESFKQVYEFICDRQMKNIAKKKDPIQGLEKAVFRKLLKAILLVHDPHSAYFSLTEKIEFIISNWTDTPSFGIDLESNDLGNVEIVSLTPGGSAWSTNKLNEGDILIGIKDPVGTYHDLTLFDPSEVIDLLNTVGDQIELFVRKKSGKKVSTILQKRMLREDENIIKSLILEKDNSRIAFIILPSFYSQDDANSTSSAQDLAAEIFKLKNEDIDGVILDVRDNGGGSMKEALDIAGIFINAGALIIYRQDGKDVTLKDSNMGTVYDGPLLLMVNSSSASASELLAATLQDHSRALIVGSPTYGKGTAQTVQPLFKGSSDDFVKLTVAKFYRVTGKSHQKRGVIPNIYLPGVFEGLGFQEAEKPFAFSPDLSRKKAYYDPLDPLPLEPLVEQSRERVAANSSFKNIVEVNNHLRRYIKRGRLVVPLNKKGFAEFFKFEELNISEQSRVIPFNISLNSYDTDIHELDEYGKEFFEMLKVDISEDPHIEECFNIILDLIELEK